MLSPEQILINDSINYKELISWAENFDSHRSLDALAAALFVGDSDPGARLMAMFTAYFDASGTPEQPFIVVAGYIANLWQWRMFESSWNGLHADAGLNIPFHMSEFQAAVATPERYAKQSNARADYVEIAKDAPKATEFFKRLCICQLTMVNCAVSCAVPMSTYNNVSSLLDLRKVVPPYAFAARLCLQAVHEWQTKFQVQGVEYIFEEGDFEQGKFTELMTTEGLPIPIYKKKKDFAGLQAADQYAWEELFNLKQELYNSPVLRNSFRLLLESIPSIRIEATMASLIKMCEVKGIDPRTGVRK